MSEGYLILSTNCANVKQVNLLARSIRHHDSQRPISVVTTEYIGSELWHGFDHKISLENYYETPLYYKSCMSSPYDATIVFQPNQILTWFNRNIWENLLGMAAIVIPKTRRNFNSTMISSEHYYHGAIELKTFNDTSILNAAFFNKTKGSDTVMGMGLVMATHYDQAEFIRHFKGTASSIPNFPKYIWPEWLMSFLYAVSNYKINKFDFVNCIDLTKQENRPDSLNWNTRTWSEFLTYWVNESGDLKIENFIQSGLVNYSKPDWLDNNITANLTARYQ